MTRASPIVWVIQEGNNDYAPAEQFGEVRFITTSDLRSTPNSRQNVEVRADVTKFISQYVAGLDYVVPVGNPMIIAMLILRLDRGIKHNFLKWDGRRATYIPFSFNSESE